MKKFFENIFNIKIKTPVPDKEFMESIDPIFAKILSVFAPTLAFLYPLVSYARCVGPQYGISVYICAATDVIGAIIPITFMLAIIFFFYAMMKFVFSIGDEKAKTQGHKIMLWGILALFIGSSLWGILQIVNQVFNFSPGGIIPLQPI